jgi:hypothetical protein
VQAQLVLYSRNQKEFTKLDMGVVDVFEGEGAERFVTFPPLPSGYSAEWSAWVLFIADGCNAGCSFFTYASHQSWNEAYVAASENRTIRFDYEDVLNDVKRRTEPLNNIVLQLAKPVDAIGLSHSVETQLADIGIYTVRDLVRRSRRELIEEGLSRSSLMEVIDVLKSMDLQLSSDS